ncbi:MAG: hypothetical protein GX579_19570, partial [Chloroflexi bacterium]|nr:hypothetical protein [Chloroflexota bacterium]
MAWTWLALLSLAALLRRPTARRALATGVCAAAAALTQFFGSVAVVVVFVAWAGQQRRQRRHAFSSAYTRWLVAGLLLVAGPYLLYTALHWPDALGQTAYLKGERATLGVPALVDNLGREPVRYRTVLNPRDASGWVNLACMAAAVVYLGLQLGRRATAGDRLLA